MLIYKGHMSDKTTMQKSYKLDQAFMNNIEKTSNCIFKSGRLSLQYFEYAKHAIQQSFKSEHRKSTNNVREVYCSKLLMLHVSQNERKKAFGRSPSYQE